MNKQILAVTLMTALTILGGLNHVKRFDSDEVTNSWESFKNTHSKSYSSDMEEAYRFAIFSTNLHKIAEHNANIKTATFGVTQFADLTAEEFKAIYLTAKTAETSAPVLEAGTPNGSVDWNSKGAVTGVKDQGQCGSCWAFGAVGGAEGRYQITTGTLASFSEQQLTSCDTNEYGCQGGYPQYANEYITEKGLMSEDSYPYVSGSGSVPSCQYDSSNLVVQPNAFSNVSQATASKSGYLSALDTQPLDVCLAATAFQLYTGGVLSSECDSQMDHCTTGIAYDESAGWARIKNSWGTTWGEDGMVRISIADDAPSNGYCALYGSSWTMSYSA